MNNEELRIGQYVTHPKRPDWGDGEILAVTADKVKVNFREAGIKTLMRDIVQLRASTVSRAIPLMIDSVKLEELCNRFHAELEDNRPNTDDGGIGLEILADVKRRGMPTKRNKNRLLNWCYSDGNPYQKGFALAREICVVLYGRLLPDPDSMRLNVRR